MTIHHDFVHMVIHKHRTQQLRAEAHQDRLAKLVQSSRRTKKSCRRRTTDDVIDGGIGTSAKTDLGIARTATAGSTTQAKTAPAP